jgi:hypothetical protein
MALDFPSSPTTGQTFSSPGGTTWTYDGAKWGNGTLLTIPDAPSDANTYGRHAGSWNVALTGITSSQVTGALGYVPYNQTNPAGYQTSAQVSAALPVASSTAPLMDGTAAIGTGTTWARADHVHASDTSRAPLASPNFTGGQTTAGVVNSTGAGGGYNFNDRATSLLWALYANSSVASIYNATNSNVVNIDISGNLTTSGNITTAGIFTAGAGTGSGVVYPGHAVNVISFGWLTGTLHGWVDSTDLGPIQFTASSARYKTNIVPATKDAVACLRGIELFAFDRSGDALVRERHEDIGFIAEQVRDVLPEAVVGEEEGAVGGLDLMPLMAYTVRAIQQLAAQNAALEARIAALEGAR